MKKTSMWVAAVAIGVSGASAFGQANRFEAQEQQRRERQERQEQRREGRQGEQRREGREAERASERQERGERQQMRKEREQLGNMPKGARRALRAATEGATEIDFRREGEERDRVFLARYRAPNGHVMETRVDREGKVLSTRDETAEAAAAAARARGEQAPPPQQPVAQQPAQPGTPGAQGTITAASGPTGKLELAQLPRPVQDTFTREIRGAGDVEIYRGFQGSQPVFVAYWTEPTNNKEMALRVDDSGRVVNKKEIDDNQADPSRLTLNELPRPAQETIRRESRNAGEQDLRIYRGKQGQQDVFVAYFDRGGREVSLRVDDQGRVVSERPIGGDDRAQAAGAREPANPNAALSLNDLPREARDTIRREAGEGRDVRIYRGKQGQQDVFVAYYTKGGKEMALRVDDQGKVVSNREVGND